MLRLHIELRKEVCSFLLRDNPDEEPDRRAVFMLAQTCKTLFEPAADCLWHTIPSVALLAYLLPRDAWTAVNEPGFEGFNCI